MRKISICLVVLSLVVPARSQMQGRFSGLTYFDYYYNIERPANQSLLSNAAVNGPKDLQGFQIRRLFFTYDDDLSKEFATKLRMDADQQATTSDGRISFYLKDASLTWKNIFRGSNLCVGLQPTLPFEVIESVWGFRSIEKTILDLRGLVSTRDMGVSLKGRMDEEDIIEYGILVGNNSASKPSSTKYKRYYGQVVVKPIKNFILAMCADYNDRALAPDPYDIGLSVANGTLTGDVFAGLVDSGICNAGIELSSGTTFHGYNNGITLGNLQSIGISAFGSVHIHGLFTVVGRFDYFDPNVDASARGDSRNYFMVGVAWNPIPAVSLIPNALYEMYEAAPGGTNPSSSVTARITINYVFL